MFIPFGFGIACLTKQFKLNVFKALLVVLVSSFTLSFLVEFCQIFLPTRNPTYVDILTNTISGVLGFLFFKFLGVLILDFLNYIFTKLNKWKSITNLTIIFLIYFYLACLLSFNLQGMTKLWALSNWNPNYYLSLGNEITGKRPWYGKIFEFCLADRAFSEIEIERILPQSNSCNLNDAWIASYVLTKQGNYQNLKKNTPNLIEQERSINQQWLKTETSAAFINQKIRDRSQFTIVTTLASSNLDQTGPTRIISLSQDPFHRNLTIGQWHNHLSIRLRTPLTKQNGTRPEFIVPNVFADNQIHHLIISYNRQVLSVYLDNLSHQHSFKFSPAATLFWYLSPSFSSMIHLTLIASWFYQLLYYGVIFIPLGILARMICDRFKVKWYFYWLAVIGLTILPAFLLETFLATTDQTNINIQNFIFSALLSLGIFKMNFFTKVNSSFNVD